MEILAYIILGIVAVGWIIAMIIGFITAYPSGLIGLVIIFAIGLLFIKVLKERIENKDDDYYNKNIIQ